MYAPVYVLYCTCRIVFHMSRTLYLLVSDTGQPLEHMQYMRSLPKLVEASHSLGLNPQSC